MEWNYRWIRYTDQGNEVFLHEVFYKDNGEIDFVTQAAVSLVADDAEGIPKLLKMIELDSTLPILEMTTTQLLNQFPEVVESEDKTILYPYTEDETP